MLWLASTANIVIGSYLVIFAPMISGYTIIGMAIQAFGVWGIYRWFRL